MNILASTPADAKYRPQEENLSTLIASFRELTVLALEIRSFFNQENLLYFVSSIFSNLLIVAETR